MKQFDIWMADLPRRVGMTSVVWGKRPVVIVSNNLNNEHSEVVLVVPLTSRLGKTQLPTHVFLKDQGLDVPSYALCEQIMPIDKCELLDKMGVVEKKWDRMCLLHAMQVQLGMVEA
jgi:mRNA interferase MazF